MLGPDLTLDDSFRTDDSFNNEYMLNNTSTEAYIVNNFEDSTDVTDVMESAQASPTHSVSSEDGHQ